MNVGGGGGALGFSFGGGAPGGAGAGASGGGAQRPPAQPVSFAIAPGGGRIRGTRPPSIPVVLSRNGKEFVAEGETNVRAGSEYKVITERQSLPITVRELDAGSWVMFELPGFTTASAGTEVDSLDALRAATTTSYYKGEIGRAA